MLGSASMAASLETPTRSRGSLSVGRFNWVLGLGAMTAYGVRRNNRTLMIGDSCIKLAYKKWSRSRTRLRSPVEKIETTIYRRFEIRAKKRSMNFAKGAAKLRRL